MSVNSVHNLSLSPYRVIDLTCSRGAICGRIMGDLGADVVKVEPPAGDPARGRGPFFPNTPPSEASMEWWAYNINKRGITLDIQTEDGKELLKALVRRTDFLIESFAPEFMDNLGLGYDVLKEQRPELIMVSITPFGQTGPRAPFQGPDLVVQALGGFMYVTGDEDRPPVRISYPLAYILAGAEGAAAALISHYYRFMTGEGQHVDVSAQQCVVWTLMACTAWWEITGVNVRRKGNVFTEPLPPRPNHWRCKDGQISYINYQGPLFAEVSKRLYGLVEEVDGVNTHELRSKSWLTSGGQLSMTEQDLEDEAAILGPFFLHHTKDELHSWALERRIMLTPVNTPKEVLEDTQLKARGYFAEVENPRLGRNIQYPGAFVKMSDTPCEIRRHPPSLGEHNQEIYMGELGMSKDDVSFLKAAGVI